MYHHLIPGLGKHRLDKIEREHFEKLYARILAEGRKPAMATKSIERHGRRSEKLSDEATSHGIRYGSNSAMAKRYPHVTAVLRQDVAKRLDAFIWNDN